MATDIIARGMTTEYKSGTNIDFKENEDGSVTISASGDVSSEDTVAREAIDNHKLDKNNPHNVTAEQVGLGNVDNTADLDKPISTAVQTALDDKANTKHTHKKSDITDFPNSLPANGGNADTVNNHTVESDVPADAVFTDTTNSDVTIVGNPVQIDGLQGGVPFSEITVSGKNLLTAMSNSVTRNGITYTVNADGTITLNGTAEKADGVDVAFKIPLKAGVYTLSGCPKGGSATSFALRAGLGTANTLYGRDYGNGLKITTETDTVITVTIQNAEIGRVFDNVVFRPQLELGSTPTAYEPPITGRELTVNVNGTDYTITTNSNPYTVPNDIRQQDGLNVISVSEGEISVTGVRKNAAVKKIWDEMGMDLLFDGVTSADNPAVVNLAKYNMIRIDVGGNYEGTSYFNCGSTYFSKSTLDFAVTSYEYVAIPLSNQAVIISISKSGAEYSLSFSGFNEKQLVDVIKIYGIK